MKRVLIAESHPVDRRVVSKMLAKLGYEWIAVRDGIEVLDRLEQEKLDLVLLGSEMSEMGRYRTAREIRRRGLQLPIVVLSEDSKRRSRDRYLEVGVNGFLSKPIVLEQLGSAISHWLGGAPNVGFPEMETASIDFVILAKLRELATDQSSEIYRELLESFLQDSSSRIASLGQAIEQGDGQEARRLLHGLRGSSSSLGAIGLHGIAEEMSARIRSSKSTTHLGDLLAELRVEMERVESILLAEIA